MENFQELMTQAAHLKQQELKKERTYFQSLPNFVKSGLNYFKKYQQLRKQDFLIQFFVSQLLKKQGNKLITNQQYQNALHKYQQSLAVFKFIQTKTNQNLKDDDLIYHDYQPTPNYRQQYDKHICSLYLNLALCLIKLNKKEQALCSADYALKIQPSSAKAYYRKSQAHLQYINRNDEDIKQGLQYLENAYSISKDQQIYKQIIKTKKMIKQEKAKAKKAFSFMFKSDNPTLSQSAKINKKIEKEQQTPKKANCKSLEKKKQNSLIEKKLVQKQQQKFSERCLTNNEKVTNEKQNKLAQKSLHEIREKEAEKQFKTQKKLMKLLQQPDWKLSLVESFILKKGQKIYAMLELYNYKQYLDQYKQCYSKCLTIFKKSALKSDSYKSEQGQDIHIDFEEQQVKKIMQAQKQKIYAEYVTWLEKHPIPEIKKYIQRYRNQYVFLEKKYLQKYEIKAQRKIIQEVKQEKDTSLTIFYLAATLIIFWMIFNIYRAFQSQI